MSQYSDREAFIPYRRSDLVDICLEEGKLNDQDAQRFREFCDILSAYYHFKSQKLLESLKYAFAPFNPDSDTIQRQQRTPEEKEESEQYLVESFKRIVEKANYSPLSEEELQEAFSSESLIPLKTEVDFNDYEHIVCYYRSNRFKNITVPHLMLWKKEIEVDSLERVALLFKFKDEAYFRDVKKQKIEDLNFTPGKTYMYIYKNIPRFDLEVLFPNVEVRMNWKDRLFVLVPAIGGAVPLLLKVIPSLLLIVGLILLFTMGADAASSIANVEGEDAQNIFPALVAALTAGMTLGGFAARQYGNYKKKELSFLKQVSDTLFFKNLDTNEGVLYTLIDSAEEEECKEIILVYYHLLASKKPLTAEQLDNHIEEWMEEHFQVKIDFDIRKTLENLASLQAPIQPRNSRIPPKDGNNVPLLHTDTSGICHVLPIDDAKQLIDHIWDNAFQYA